MCGIDRRRANPVWAAFVGLTKAWWESAVPFTNVREGWQIWEEKLRQLDVPAGQILIGMEATSCSHENLYHELEQRGYVLRLLQAFSKPINITSVRACVPRPIGLMRGPLKGVLVSGEARAGYVRSRTGGHVSGTGPLAYALER